MDHFTSLALCIPASFQINIIHVKYMQQVFNETGCEKMADEINELLEKERYGDTDTLRSLLDYIIQKYNVGVNLTDIAGFSKIDSRLSDLFDHFSYHNNCFCNNIKKNSENLWLCVKSKNRLCKVFNNKRDPFYGRCYMGIQEIYYPVRFHERLISLICIGQFSDHTEKSIEFVRHKAEKYGLDPEDCVNDFIRITKDIDFSISDLNRDAWAVCNYMALLYRNRILESAVHSGLSEDVSSTADYYQNKYIVSSAMDFINRNYSDRISLSILSKSCHCNATYLSHLFRKETGVRITDYINRCRVERAKHLLDITDLTVTQISGEVGFGDSGYFSRTFKKMQGLSPAHYRNRNT
jgi:AraC-like DNA-binding protein/ligand-binding sensor protein